MKKPTQREKIQQYESLLHDLAVAASVTQDHDRVAKLLQNIHAWSYAHRCGNGELTELQQQQEITAAFWQLGNRLK